MKRQWILCVLALIFSLVGAAPALAAEKRGGLPRVLNLATMPVGMIVNAQAVGIADIGSKYTPIRIKVMPATNEMAWMPMITTGEVHLGVATAVALRQAYLGTFVFKEIAEKSGVKGFPLRVVTGGSPIRVNLMVPGDSPIKTIAGLKGTKHVVFSKGTHFQLYTDALLASDGLSVRDIIPVPVANPIESARALLDGRVDGCQLAVGAPIGTELVAKLKARWLPVDSSPEAVKRIKEIMDVAYVAECPGGIFQGVPKPQSLLHGDVIFVAHKDLSDSAVYELTKALWQNNAELVKRPGLIEWVREKFLFTEHRVPYHSGSIKFFKEMGLWTKDMVKFQKKVLAEEP